MNNAACLSIFIKGNIILILVNHNSLPDANKYIYLFSNVPKHLLINLGIFHNKYIIFYKSILDTHLSYLFL